MKVYFDATPSRYEEYKHIYKRIGNLIEKSHTLTSRWIIDFDESFFSMPRADYLKHYKQIIKALNEADVVVFDISVSSTTSGQLIQSALLSKKPVIALQDNTSRKNIFLEGAGEAESKLLLVEYNDSDLEEKLTQAFEFVEDWLETRFTLILDGETRKLLDEVTKNGISRSEFIRKLIKSYKEK